jgi:drug/metabolite transporter (DMT)-like permease
MSIGAAEKKGIVYMVSSVFCFAVVNAIAKYLAHFPVHELIFFRSIVAFVFCVLYLRHYKIPLWGNNRFWLVARGLIGLVALYLFFQTIRHMPLASASTIQYLSPVFTVLVATQLNGQGVKKIQWLYFAIAFAGTALIKGYDGRVSTEWLLVGVSSALLAGFAYNAIIKSRGTDHPMVIVMYVPLVALPFTGLLCLFDWVWPQGWEWFLLFLMGIFTQAAQYMTTLALHSDVASKIAPWNYFGALFALIFGYVLFDEMLTWLSFVGMLLVVIGVVLNSRVKTQALKSIDTAGDTVD